MYYDDSIPKKIALVTPVNNGKLRSDVSENLKKWIHNNEGNTVRITMEVFDEENTIFQKGYYHGVVLPIILQFHNEQSNLCTSFFLENGEEIRIEKRLNKKELHNKLKKMFLGTKSYKNEKGITLEKPISTKTLNKREFFPSFIDPICQFYRDFFNLDIPYPTHKQRKQQEAIHQHHLEK